MAGNCLCSDCSHRLGNLQRSQLALTVGIGQTYQSGSFILKVGCSTPVARGTLLPGACGSIDEGGPYREGTKDL